MAEQNCNLPESINEAVCIDAGRVYDSCCDRDCLEDLRCYFRADDQAKIERANGVRVRSAEVVNVYIDVEPVSFNRGYYSCDLTFLFLMDFDLFSAPHNKLATIKGISLYNKKVILFGSEGNVKVFSNETTLEDQIDNNLRPHSNMPKCVVQCVDPIALSSRIGKAHCNYETPCCRIPRSASECLGGEIFTDVPNDGHAIYVTIGLFSIVQLIRNVQMLIPVYDFCIPEKQCDDSTEHPCDIFKRLKFPTDDFFPPKSGDDSGCCDCGCQN